MAHDIDLAQIDAEIRTDAETARVYWESPEGKAALAAYEAEQRALYGEPDCECFAAVRAPDGRIIAS